MESCVTPVSLHCVQPCVSCGVCSRSLTSNTNQPKRDNWLCVCVCVCACVSCTVSSKKRGQTTVIHTHTPLVCHTSLHSPTTHTKGQGVQRRRQTGQKECASQMEPYSLRAPVKSSARQKIQSSIWDSPSESLTLQARRVYQVNTLDRNSLSSIINEFSSLTIQTRSKQSSKSHNLAFKKGNASTFHPHITSVNICEKSKLP